MKQNNLNILMLIYQLFLVNQMIHQKKLNQSIHIRLSIQNQSIMILTNF